MERIDTLPYKTFLKLKQKYVVKTILITEQDLSMQGIHLAFKNHREYIEYKFKQQGVEIYRFAHKYSTLGTSNPELGLVFLSNDSVIQEGMEVHALIGHNAKYLDTVGAA